MRYILITIYLIIIMGCEKQSDLPNIIIIFTDDQGYGDVGCYGAEGFVTPNIDSMAKEGILFTDFYVSQAVCSASRASLMTGSYAERVGVQGALSPWNVTGLDPDRETIAKLLKRYGYTNAIFGKWHLGHKEKYLPLQNGFDEYAGLICSNDMWPVDYDGNPLIGEKRSYYPPMAFWRGNEPSEKIESLKDQGKLTTKITELAVDFISRNKNNPFFLYVPHPMPHQPIAVSEKFEGKSELGLYGDVIMEIDWSVGQILEALKINEIDENTLVIYASDNGPWLNYGEWGGSAGPLREGKGTMWEGGARVPCIMRWPKTINSGRINNKIAATIDIYPTIADIVGHKKFKNKIDGVSLMPILEELPEAEPRNELYYYYGKELIAVRKGKWKLVFPHTYRSYENVEPGKDLHPGPYGRGKAGLELYDLANDIGERVDLAQTYPDVVMDLEILGEKARSILGDKLTDRIGVESYDAVCGFDPPLEILENSAVGKSILMENYANKKYPGESKDALINGLGASINYRDPSWQGFEAEDLIATIDLGSITKINSVNVRFLQDQVVWIFLPKKVEIEHSLDGDNFDMLYESYQDNDFSFDQNIYNYLVEPKGIESRYIRIKGYNLDQCPDYHPGAGRPCWLFTDEIIIN
jgi:arylsulfatase A-like enzyme